MSNAIVIHVLRPYANEEDYLASERFSIDSKSMLLIDQPPLAVDTPIVFDVQLENGQKPIRAEARVTGHVAATADNPGGLRVRFKRFGAATKAFIDRAISAPSATAPMPEQEVPALDTVVRPASIRPAPPLAPELATVEFGVERAASAVATDRSESSGIHRRPVMPVAAPVNREELLERLRTRARHVAAARTNESNPGEQTA